MAYSVEIYKGNVFSPIIDIMFTLITLSGGMCKIRDVTGNVFFLLVQDSLTFLVKWNLGFGGEECYRPEVCSVPHLPMHMLKL